MKKVQISYIFSRFSEMYNLYVRGGIFLEVCYFIDWIISFIINGASIYDYFAYDFYHKRIFGRSSYITYRKFIRIQDRCNRWSDFNLLRDKAQFNELFRDLLGRQSINLAEATQEQFIAFCQPLQEVFVKDAMSLQGKGIHTFIPTKVDLAEKYTELKQSGIPYLIEEKIVQCKELAAFHPESINTVRVTSVYNDTTQEVTIATACVRMGVNESRVDNFCSGGIIANIDVPTGFIKEPGFNEDEEIFFIHPNSKKQIIGYHIPYWEECKAFIQAAAKRLPTVRYVGWDVVILEGGKFLLIEGNNDADFTSEQMHGEGLWPLYDSLTKDLKPVN